MLALQVETVQYHTVLYVLPLAISIERVPKKDRIFHLWHCDPTFGSNLVLLTRMRYTTDKRDL